MTPSPRIQPLVHVSVAVLRGDRLLLVREEKAQNRGLWNLPGGHVERGEAILDAADREMREETRLTCPLQSLLGVYSSPTAVRFVFRCDGAEGDAAAGDEIMEVAWAPLADLARWPDDTLVSPALLRAAVADLRAGRAYPLQAFVAVMG